MKAASRDAGVAPVEFRQLCRALAERSPLAMIAVDGVTRIVSYANPAFHRLLGDRRVKRVGRPLVEALPESIAPGASALVERVFRTGIAEILPEQRHVAQGAKATPSGASEAWSYAAWPILAAAGADEDQPVGVMVQVTDTTEIAAFRRDSVAINAALLESGVRLHEMIETAADLNSDLRRSEAREHEARLAAESADRSKEIFLATLSHELRTPLNAILGWSMMLQETKPDGTRVEPDPDHALQVIERNSRVLARLIEEVLDVARIASGKFVLDRQPCDLLTVVGAVADAIRPAAAAKHIEVTMTAAPHASSGALAILADEARLTQALLNLLGNAVKFTPDGGRVTVRVERASRAAARTARVVVADTGRGIAPEFLPFVFDRFQQADVGNARMFGGLGLGLTIVRQIIEQHGGSVTVHSAGEGHGATFTVELPLLPPADRPARAVPGRHATSRDTGAEPDPLLIQLDGLRVLVVDEDEEARTAAQMALHAVGADVTTTASAAQAFALATQTDPPPHVLVAGVAILGEDGYALLRHIRDSGADARQLPAVAVTAHGSLEARREALLAGFQVHMHKPVDPLLLIATVARLSGRLTS